METVKKIGVLLLLGFVLGAGVSSVIGPRFIEWDNTPGSGLQAVCPCVETIRHGTSSLIRWQLIGGAVGAVMVAALGIIISRARAQGAASAAASSATTKPS